MYNSFLKGFYTDYSKSAELSYNHFLNKKKYVNGSTGKALNIRSFNGLLEDNYLWITFVSDEMSRKYSDDYTAFFITLTTKSEYHDISTSRSQSNRRFNFINRQEAIYGGYKELLKSFKRLYHNFSVKGDYIKTKYLRVIEPHKKDYSPHLHGIIYVPNEFIEEFKRHINKTININSEIGQTDVEVLRDTRKASGYITKYIKKGLKARDFDGWKRINKIRVFTHSRDVIPRYIFKIISGRIEINEELRDKSSYIYALLSDTCISVITNLKDGTEQFKEYGNIEGSNKVLIIRDFVKKPFLNKEKDTFFIDEDELIYESDGYYKVNHWEIDNGITEIILKPDWVSYGDYLDTNYVLTIDEEVEEMKSFCSKREVLDYFYLYKPNDRTYFKDNDIPFL